MPSNCAAAKQCTVIRQPPPCLKAEDLAHTALLGPGLSNIRWVLVMGLPGLLPS